MACGWVHKDLEAFWMFVTKVCPTVWVPHCEEGAWVGVRNRLGLPLRGCSLAPPQVSSGGRGAALSPQPHPCTFSAIALAGTVVTSCLKKS